MAETTLLRSNAIQHNASLANQKPGQVNVGGLPSAQIKPVPRGPQVHEGQQKPVTILPGKDPQGAVAAGGLPMVQIKMTQNGAQRDDGQEQTVVIKDNRQTLATGGLPVVDVKMTKAGPEVQNMPTVSSAPPQIASAPPALSAPRVTRIVAPQAAAAPVLDLSLPLTTDHLMLCRHQVDKYASELRAAAVAAATTDVTAETSGEAPAEIVRSPSTDAIKFADEAIAAIDATLELIAARAAQPPVEQALAVVPAVAAAPPRRGFSLRPAAGGHFTPAGALTARTPGAPNVTHVTRPTATHAASGSVRTQGNTSMAPRRVARKHVPGEPLPPVIVKMDGGRPTVQNQDEVAAARAAVVPAAATPTTSPLPPVIVKMNGGRPQVQNQAEIAAAKAAFEAEVAASVGPGATLIAEREPDDDGTQG